MGSNVSGSTPVASRVRHSRGSVRIPASGAIAAGPNHIDFVQASLKGSTDTIEITVPSSHDKTLGVTIKVRLDEVTYEDGSGYLFNFEGYSPTMHRKIKGFYNSKDNAGNRRGHYEFV